MDMVVWGLCGFTVFAVIVKLWPLFRPTPKNRWTGEDMNRFQNTFFQNFLNYAQYWNEYEVHGDDVIQGPNTLLVGPHSRCAFDNWYILSHAQTSWIASHFLFLIPGFASVFTWMGASPSKGLHGLSSNEEFLKLIVEGKAPLWVLPGGAYEAYRTYENRNTLDWKEEPGFARILTEYANSEKMAKSKVGTQIVPFYTRQGDSVFYNHPWWYNTSSFYTRYALKEIAKKNVEAIIYLIFFAGAGMGFLLFPRPVKLDTHYGEPVYVKKGESAKSLGARVKKNLQDLIDKTNNLPAPAFTRPSTSMSAYLYAVLFGIFMFIQNLLFIVFCGVWIMGVAIPIFIVRGILARNKDKKKVA